MDGEVVTVDWDSPVLHPEAKILRAQLCFNLILNLEFMVLQL